MWKKDERESRKTARGATLTLTLGSIFIRRPRVAVLGKIREEPSSPNLLSMGSLSEGSFVHGNYVRLHIYSQVLELRQRTAPVGFVIGF